MTHIDDEGRHADLLARLDRLERRNVELERRSEALAAQVAALTPPAPPGPVPPTAALAPPAPSDARGALAGSAPNEADLVDRRHLLRRGAAAAAAVGVVAASVVALDGVPAAASNGDPIILGTDFNLANAPTFVGFSGASLDAGFGVIDSNYSSDFYSAALFGHAKGGAFDTGLQVRGQSDAAGIISVTDTGNAIQGYSVGGVAIQATTQGGNTSPAVNVTASAVGVAVQSTKSQLYLKPVPPNPTTTAAASLLGELRVDSQGTAWLCTAAGNPGTWRKLAGPSTAGAFHALASPVRVYDSRPGSSPAQTPKAPLAAGATRSLGLAITGGTAPVPPGATAAAVNVLLVNAASGNGNFTLWANGAAKPQANTLVWGGSTGRFSTFAVTAVDAAAKVQVSANLATDLVLDVVGYYR